MENQVPRVDSVTQDLLGLQDPLVLVENLVHEETLDLQDHRVHRVHYV